MEFVNTALKVHVQCVYIHGCDGKSLFFSSYISIALRHVCDDVRCLDMESLIDCGPWNQ